MTVDETIDSIHPPYRRFEAGPRHFTGVEALDYVRQRYQFVDGDFTRIKHQQMFLKALLDKAVSVGTVTNIGNLKDFVSSVASAMIVDKDFSLIDLAWQFHSLRSDDLNFLVTPNLGTDTDGRSERRGLRPGEHVVLLSTLWPRTHSETGWPSTVPGTGPEPTPADDHLIMAGTRRGCASR